MWLICFSSRNTLEGAVRDQVIIRLELEGKKIIQVLPSSARDSRLERSSWALLWCHSLGIQEETGGREGKMPTQGLAPSWEKDCLSLHIEPWITQTPVFLPLLEIIAVATQVQSLFMLFFQWTIFGSLNYSLYLNTETLVSGAWVLDRGGQRMSQYPLLASVISLYPSNLFSA